MGAEKVAVWLSKKDTQILRRLIIEEGRRAGITHLDPRDIPRRYRGLMTVARKVWEARQHFSGKG